MGMILEVIEGPQQGETFTFERSEAFVIGRMLNDRVQFRIPRDPYLSRYHMIIESGPGQCLLRDLGSTNGTRVNGLAVREASLEDGDVIEAGESKIRVRIEASPPPPPVAAISAEGSDRSDSLAQDRWDTQLFNQVAVVDGGRLRCSICNEPAAESHLGDQTETRILAYVCSPCRELHQDPDQPVPNYRKLETLARGALGPVFKARRISTGKDVVLKILAPELHANPQAIQLFLRQMRLAAGLVHPRIVPIVEMGQAGKDLWIAGAYVEGVDARKLAQQLGGTVPLRDSLDIACQLLEALDYAHGRNLVHRDVKPSNLLVAGHPGAYDAHLSDFGLIRNMDEAGLSGITGAREARGSIPFMPPEQVLDCRFVKAAGDIYSVGATLYWLLTGELTRDFEALDARGEVKDPYLIILEGPITPIRRRNPAIPEPVARVVETALAQEPEDRYESASEMARALRKALA